MDAIDMMKEARRGLNLYGRDVAIDHSNAKEYDESVARFDEFKKLCKRIVELSRPIK